jgi:hypothetical protein
MSAHFCDGCGDGHDWRDCPEVEESIFEHDPEWDAEEPPPPMDPLADPPEPRVGQGMSPHRTHAVLWTEHGKWLISRRF